MFSAARTPGNGPRHNALSGGAAVPRPGGWARCRKEEAEFSKWRRNSNIVVGGNLADRMVSAARELRAAVEGVQLGPPVTHVYNPLDYAWEPHETYLRKYANCPKRALFLGMNPGPFGMVQTGVPFGEVSAVRDWMGIDAPIGKPLREFSKRPVEGFACARSEVSGRRLWGLFAKRFGPATSFFADYFVVNYCPLALFDKEGRNLTPDKLPSGQATELFGVCDQHLDRVLEILQPEWLIGVGDFAEKRARSLFTGNELKIGRILHPSPASPAANRDWAGQATQQLVSLGIWK